MNFIPALGVNLKNYDPNVLLGGKLWRITEKIDGVRRFFWKDTFGKVKAYTRTGLSDPWLAHITTYLEDENFPSDMIYDTELVDLELYIGNADSVLLRIETTSVAAQQYWDNKRNLGAICFDMVRPNGDITKGAERHQLLTKTFLQSPIYYPIFQVPYYGVLEGNDVDTLAYLMHTVIAREGEGLMLMDLSAPYINGRSNTLVKVKRLEDYIGTVIDMEFASIGSKIEGGIASLICNVDGCTVPVRVGTGLSKEERLYFAKNPPLGKLIEIEAFGRTKNRYGEVSLSMPVFKRLKEGGN